MSEQPLASSRVELSIDFDDLDDELKRDLRKRVQRVADDVEKTLNEIPKTSKRTGKAVAADIGGGAKQAAAAVRKAAAEIEKALDEAGEAADGLADGADTAAKSLRRLSQAGQGSLFDIDESGKFVEVRQQIEAVQEALFDLDSVEIDRVEQSADRAATTLRGRLVAAARRAGAAIASIGSRRGGGGLDELGDQVARLGRNADRGGPSLNRYTTRLSLLAGAIALGVGAAPALIAAGAGIGAALALSVPTITAVIKGTTEMSDRWDGLTDSQQIAAASTRQLINQYKAVSAAVEPSVLRLYNAAVADTIGLLPRLAPLATEGADALTRTSAAISEGFDSQRGREFFTFLETSAGPSIDALTELLLDLGAALASTTQAVAPLAPAVIGLVGGALRLLTVLNDINFAFIQLALLAVTLRTPLAAAGSLMSSGAGRAAKFAKDTGKAAGAARLLNLVASAGPNLYVAAGVAIAFFAVKALTAKRAIDETISAVNAQNRAFGNNIEGYLAANRVLEQKLIPIQQRLAAATRQVGREANFTNLEIAKGAIAFDDLAGSPLRAAMDANTAAIRRVQTAAQLLVASGFAPSIAAAQQLAEAAGVDLSKSLTESGELTGAAAAKIAVYSASIRTAKDTTIVLADAWSRARNEGLGLEKQAAALQEVFNRFLNPTLGLLDATTRLKEVQAETARVLAEGNVSVLQREQLVGKEVTALRDKIAAEKLATGSTAATTAETLRLIPALFKLAGNSRIGKRAVFDLARSLNGAREDAQGAVIVVNAFGEAVRVLPDGKVVEISANTAQAEGALSRVLSLIGAIQRNPSVGVLRPEFQASGGLIDFKAAGGVVGAVGRVRALAAGGPSGRVVGPGTGTSDSILTALSNGEYVVNAAQTRRWLPLLEALNAGRFADGGLVGRVRRMATGGQVGSAGTGAAVVLRIDRLDLSSKAEATLRRRLDAIGDKLGADLTRSLLGSPAEISKSVRSVEKQITKAFRGIDTRIDDRLVSRLESLNGKLTSLGKQRDKIIASIEDAQQLAESTTTEARRFAGLAGFSDDERASGATIEKTLRERLAAIKTFQRDIQALAARGLTDSLLRQIIEGGPEEGGALAATLRRASATTLFQINATQKKIDAATRNLGRDSADLLFDAGRQASKGFLTGLQADRRAIVKLMTEIAESVSLTVRKTLKIKSPSRVLDKDAEDTMLGYIRGLRRLRARVQAEIADAVRPDRQVQRAAALLPPRAGEQASGRGAAAATSPARSTTINQTNNLYNVADPNAVVSIIEGRLVAALR